MTEQNENSLRCSQILLRHGCDRTGNELSRIIISCSVMTPISEAEVISLVFGKSRIRNNECLQSVFFKLGFLIFSYQAQF